MSENKLLKQPSNVKELAFGMMAYTSASIFGPLLVFGILGFFIDKKFDTKPLALIVCVLLAFFVTNLLIFKKIRVLMKKFDELDKQEKKEQNNANN